MLKVGHAHAALHLHAVHRELLAQDRLGGVLRNRDEAERDVVRQREVELRHPLTVDVNDLAAHPYRRVEDLAQHSHALEHLERSWLHANGFRILQGLEKRVDDAARDAATGELDRGRQADRAPARDQHLRL